MIMIPIFLSTLDICKLSSCSHCLWHVMVDFSPFLGTFSFLGFETSYSPFSPFFLILLQPPLQSPVITCHLNAEAVQAPKLGPWFLLTLGIFVCYHLCKSHLYAVDLLLYISNPSLFSEHQPSISNGSLTFLLRCLAGISDSTNILIFPLPG